MPLNVRKVVSPQTLETVLAGPGPSNRMFILTGIAEIDWQSKSDTLGHDSVELVLSDYHKDIPLDLDPQATEWAAAAWPASMRADDHADQVTWAVDEAFAFISGSQRPTLRMNVALQGEKGALSRIGYEVFARTTSIPIKSFDVLFTRFAPVLEVSVVLSQPAIGSGEDIHLTSGDPRVVLPAKVTVAAGTDTLTTKVTYDIKLFKIGDTPVNFTAHNAVSQKDTTTIIHREL